MPYREIAARYLKALQRVYEDSLAGRQHTAELSFRAPLDNFLDEIQFV